ncbi:MAG TPA: DNA/RNA non-specific endonuclease [Actinomycetales bacterium]
MTTPADALGYTSDFLGPSVPLPSAPTSRPVRELTYTHFTVLLDPQRRLAAATAVNIDGAALRELDRADDWFLDPRVPQDEQTGPEVYARNDLDRGHLVRRRDPVWGEPAVAAAANEQSFCYTNAAPQAAAFNQGKELWVGLEDYLLEHARAHRLRLSVFTGPVLSPDDPPYRGVQIPRLFWKVATWADLGAEGSEPTLAATAYVLDQTPQLDDLDLRTARAAAAGDVPPLGPYRTFQVPVADVEALTGLDLGPLVAADQLPAGAPTGALPAPRDRWVELTEAGSIRLGQVG